MVLFRVATDSPHSMYSRNISLIVGMTYIPYIESPCKSTDTPTTLDFSQIERIEDSIHLTRQATNISLA